MTPLDTAREIREKWQRDDPKGCMPTRLDAAIAAALEAQRKQWIVELEQQRKITCEQYAADNIIALVQEGRRECDR